METYNTPFSIDELLDALSSSSHDCLRSRDNWYERPSQPSDMGSNTVWFNDTCKEAINKRKKALRKVKSCPTCENIEEYKVIGGQARRTIKTARRQSWQNFVSSINSPLKGSGT